MEDVLAKALVAYQKGGQEALAPVLQYDFYMQSIKLYNTAFSGGSYDQRASIARNLGVASQKAAKLIEKKDTATFLYHVCQSVTYFASALQYGSETLKSEEWLESIKVLVVDNLDAIRMHPDSQLSLRLSSLHSLLSPLSPLPLLRAELHHCIATALFAAAIAQQDAGEWTQSKAMLESISMHTEEAMCRCDKDAWLRAQVEDLVQRKFIHLCIAESVVMRNRADELFAANMLQEEFLNIDFMWEVTDMYKQAAILTRENDIEAEAIAESRIGRMFSKVFKIKDKAQVYYHRAIELALTLVPRDLSARDWYIEAREFLQEYQNQKKKEEEERDLLWKQPILDELKEELTAMREQANTVANLLAHIYVTHPPKNPLFTIPTESDDKKKLLRAIAHYHPDKQALLDPSRKWQVLCEEITKWLNMHYQRFK